MTRPEMKQLAKQQIKGKVGILFLISLIIGAISAAASAVCALIPVVGSLIPTFIIGPAFTFSVIRIYLNLAKGKKPEIKDVLDGFDDFWTAFKVNFLVALFTYLWSLLFIIPGIIKGISYSQALYIAAENKGIGAREAIDRSKKMMEGHKMEYFILGLSFIGWILLGYVTLCIAYIWVIPYMSATYINFYNSLKPVEAPVVEAVAEEVAEEVETPVAE